MRADPGLIVAGVATMYAAASRQIISADDILIAWSVVGAVGGALISTLLSTNDTFGKKISKFVSSAISGFIFTPWLMHWRDWEVSPDSVMGVAAFVSVMSWGILQVAMTMGPVLFRRYVQDKVEIYMPPVRRQTRRKRKEVHETESESSSDSE